MKGKLLDLTFALNKKQRLTIEIDGDFREEFESLKSSDVSVEIKKFRERRSLNANAYAWVMIGKLAAKLHITPDEVYRQYIPDVADNFVIQPVREDMIERWNDIWCSDHIGRMTDDLGPCRKTEGYHNIRCYLGSSDYDTAQMSRLIELIVEDCKEQGIETLPPNELLRMTEEWK